MSVQTGVQSFCRSGEQESLKGAVHASACAIAMVMAVYNITAWHYRRQRHLGINAVVYSLLVAWEVKQTLHHLERCVDAVAEPPRPVVDTEHVRAA